MVILLSVKSHKALSSVMSSAESLKKQAIQGAKDLRTLGWGWTVVMTQGGPELSGPRHWTALTDLIIEVILGQCGPGYGTHVV